LGKLFILKKFFSYFYYNLSKRKVKGAFLLKN
jgi:hypothetical protein